MKVRRAMCALALVLAVAGCSSSAPKTAANTPLPSPPDVDGTLLAASDLPAGYSVVDGGAAEPFDTFPTGCAAMDAVRTPDWTPSEAKIHFFGPNYGQVHEYVYGEPRQLDGGHDEALFRQALTKCAQYKVIVGDGRTKSYVISELPFAKYGDATMAMRITTTIDGIVFYQDRVIVIKGRILAEVIHVSEYKTDIDLTEHAIAAAYRKLTSVPAGT